MNMQLILIWELLLSNFELGHKAIEETKNICCAQGEDTVNHNTVTRETKTFACLARTDTKPCSKL